MSFLAFLPLIREIVALGQSIADNVRDRREARRASAKKRQPTVPEYRCRPVEKQAPKKDGKR